VAPASPLLQYLPIARTEVRTIIRERDLNALFMISPASSKEDAAVRRTLNRESSMKQSIGDDMPDNITAKSPGPLYEGFEEDVRVMRRGGRARGPRR
jgi:hypothetical protein